MQEDKEGFKAYCLQGEAVCNTERLTSVTLKEVFISQSYFATLDTRRKLVQVNPFTPELPVTARADPLPFYCL